MCQNTCFRWNAFVINKVLSSYQSFFLNMYYIHSYMYEGKLKVNHKIPTFKTEMNKPRTKLVGRGCSFIPAQLEPE